MAGKMDITDVFEQDFINFFVIESSVAALDKESESINKKITELPRILKMQYNGIELDPLLALNQMRDQFDAMVKAKALSLLENISDTIETDFKESLENTTINLKNLIKESKV